MSRSRPLIVWLGLLSAALVGCKPDVGSSCDRGDSRCLDPATQLICSEGRMIAVPCRGEKGCWVGEGVACDISKNVAGDVCSKDDEGAATCSEDGRSQLVCLSGVFVSEPCRGPSACTAPKPCGEAGAPACQATCDRSVMQLGDSCRDAALKACNTPGTELLECKDSKMATSLHCRGSSGCQSAGGKLDCDMSVAAVDDPCPEAMNGKHACSADRLSIVECKAGRFKLDTSCAKGKLCSSQGGGIRCEEDKGEK